MSSGSVSITKNTTLNYITEEWQRMQGNFTCMALALEKQEFWGL